MAAKLKQAPGGAFEEERQYRCTFKRAVEIAKETIPGGKPARVLGKYLNRAEVAQAIDTAEPV
jgi:hypothetical protein